MPKVRVRSLRSLASKCNPSILTGAITESADYIEELEKENERLKYALKDIKNVSTLDEYEGSNPKSLLKACYDIAEKAAPREF